MKKRLFGFAGLLLAMMFIISACSSTGGSFVDTYSHASRGFALTQPGVENKVVLQGKELEAAYKFLEDSSHYLYTVKDLPSFPKWDTEWRSPVNGRVYRGPYHDPLSRSVCWISTNPNGSANVSLGSYWGIVPPGKDLPTDEAHGYVKSDKWQIFSYNSSGQLVKNWEQRKRGTFVIDASLAEYYGVPGARHLFVEVKLNHYEKRVVTPKEFYDGLLPESWSWGVAGQWAEYDPSFLDFNAFWAKSEEERTAYIEKASKDPKILEICGSMGDYLWFDILQVVSVTDLIGFEYESSQGKVNGIDLDHDGYLDKYPAGHEKAGQLILAGGTPRVPEYALYLNYNEPWWFDRYSKPGVIDVIYADRSIVPDPRKK
jgi:hypothetical protein